MGRPGAEASAHPDADRLPLFVRAAVAVVSAGLLVSAFLAPVALGAGVLVGSTSGTLAPSGGGGLLDRPPTATTVITDASGEPITRLYERYRLPVGPGGVADTMKAAIVAIEDRRFYDHRGVDPQGLARAVVSNAAQGTPLEGQGASTITMQYVKNQRLYVIADSPAERRAATADTIGRKLTEVRLARWLEGRLSKEEILGRYLDLVYFGRGAYGVEAAARTYFDTSAASLTVPQAALLAGIVRAPATYDPIDEPSAARERRDQVLTAMADAGSLTREEAAAASAGPLGVVPGPDAPSDGCVTARPGTGFFCREVVERLRAAGLEPAAGGYTIRTTLDQRATAAAQEATRDAVAPGGDVVDVAAVVAPEPDRRPVLALAANRDFGNDGDAGETALPLTTAPVRGAGSIYKIFTAAAALERGIVTPESELDVPESYTTTAFDDAGEDYTVENLGSFDDEMTLERALAESPNTPFVALVDRLGSIDPVVDVARRLGLRTTLAAPGPDGRPLAERVRDAEQASFTLGPDPTSPLDLAGVAATIEAGGIWCPPTLVTQVIDRNGRDVTPPAPPCERAVSSEVADELQGALSQSSVDGTADDAADAADWDRSMIGKTGTTQRSTSAAFLGATDRYAGAVMAYAIDEPTPVCVDPVRPCSDGDLTGGSVPADTWFDLMTPLHRGSDTAAAEDDDRDED